jgi:hypothetical protein
MVVGREREATRTRLGRKINKMFFSCQLKHWDIDGMTLTFAKEIDNASASVKNLPKMDA